MRTTSKSPLLDKSFSFALRTVKCYQHLYSKKACLGLAKQFLRSGTSIGANAEETQGGQRFYF